MTRHSEGAGPLLRAWRGWAALCTAAGTVVLPLFWEVFSGGSLLRFLALPLRWTWAWVPTRRILRAGWLSPRRLAVGVAGVGGALVLATLVDLVGVRLVHPGWFLGLEWWQRPLYPWLALLPEFHLAGRPGYLWLATGWTAAETGVWSWLLWRAGSERPPTA